MKHSLTKAAGLVIFLASKEPEGGIPGPLAGILIYDACITRNQSGGSLLLVLFDVQASFIFSSNKPKGGSMPNKSFSFLKQLRREADTGCKHLCVLVFEAALHGDKQCRYIDSLDVSLIEIVSEMLVRKLKAIQKLHAEGGAR